MTPSLERLSEMVRLAEAKTRAQKLGSETHQAAERFRAAEAVARAAETRLRDERSGLVRILEQADDDEQRLKEHVRKIAQMISSGVFGPDESKDFENLIAASRLEIETKRRTAQTSLEEIQKAAAEARKQLQAAMETYQQLRRELDRLQPQLAGDFTAEDRLAKAAENHFPAGQIRALAREVEDGAAHFGVLDSKEQLAQLTIWIGRFRRLQAMEHVDVSDEDLYTLQRVFPRLVGLSKQYEPGYIEAFRQGFNADWDAYIVDAEEQMRQATEAARRNKDIEHRRQQRDARELEQKRQAREQGQTAFEELKGVIARYHLPDEGVEEFEAALTKVISGLGASDPELIELVMPYRDLLTGGEFRALRKHLDRFRQEEAKDDGAVQEQYEDLLTLTRGRKALMIGGSAREEMRRTLQKVFQFDELDWENYEGSRPVFLDSLEQRVRNRSIDLVLLLKNFIGHHVPERLRPLCQQHEIPCLMIEHGYGPSQIAEALRKGLIKSA